jgi:hypothetical protein
MHDDDELTGNEPVEIPDEEMDLDDKEPEDEAL